MGQVLKSLMVAAALGTTSFFASADETVPEPTVPEPTVRDWEAASRTDVLAAYAAYVENHPGMYDLENSGFPAQLAAARDAGLTMADGAGSLSDYRRALAAFSAELSDGHALAYAPETSTGAARSYVWPGFAALWRGERLLVRMVDESNPLHGAEIIACDSEPIRPFLERALLTFSDHPWRIGGP